MYILIFINYKLYLEYFLFEKIKLLYLKLLKKIKNK